MLRWLDNEYYKDEQFITIYGSPLYINRITRYNYDQNISWAISAFLGVILIFSNSTKSALEVTGIWT